MRRNSRPPRWPLRRAFRANWVLRATTGPRRPPQARTPPQPAAVVTMRPALPRPTLPARAGTSWPRHAHRFRARPLHHRSHDQQFLGRWVDNEVAGLDGTLGDSDSELRGTRDRLLALGLECTRQLDARDSRLAEALHKAMDHGEKLINALANWKTLRRQLADIDRCVACSVCTNRLLFICL